MDQQNAKGEGQLAQFVGLRMVVLHEKDNGYTAARAMKDNDIGSVLVCDAHGKLTGILTDRDLVIRAICEGLDPSLVELHYLMTTTPAAIGADQTPDDALWIMSSLGVRRVPIVSAQGKPVGLITYDDLIGRIPESGLLANVVQRQNANLSRYNPEGVSKRRRGAGPSAHSVSPEYFQLARESQVELHHSSRAEQSQGRLLSLARSCFEEHGIFALDRAEIRSGLMSFLTCLVRRVLHGAAANLIAQLPKLMQETLFSEPAGPDTSIDLAVTQRVVRKCMRLTPEQAVPAVEALAEAVMLSVSSGEMQAFCVQLPRDLRGLFEHQKQPEALQQAQRVA